jgi:hypothetical protein
MIFKIIQRIQKQNLQFGLRYEAQRIEAANVGLPYLSSTYSTGL